MSQVRIPHSGSNVNKLWLNAPNQVGFELDWLAVILTCGSKSGSEHDHQPIRFEVW